MISQIKKENLKELVDYQHYLYTNPKLRCLFFELTDKCNLGCLHCGSRCTIANNQFLPFEVIESTLRSVASSYDPNEIMICLTGGEPLLHPDLCRIIETAHSLEFPVGITTNGTLINDEAAKQLVNAGLDTISVSIDGLYDVHDHFRNSAGSFEKAVEACGNLKRAGIEPEALTVVHKNNIDDLPDIYDFLVEEDFFAWRMTCVDPIGRAKANDDLLLNGAELKRLFEFIRNKRFEISNKMQISFGCSHYLGLDYENEVRDFYYQCDAGIQVASIMVNGEIAACLDIERRSNLVQGNIYRDDFVDIWENKYQIFRRDKSLTSRKCNGCRHQSFCMGDSTHTWNFDRNEPNYCVLKLMEEDYSK